VIQRRMEDDQVDWNGHDHELDLFHDLCRG
jgi:hypothetical protein